MEPWISEAITINGDLSYIIKRGEINQKYVDIEITAYSDRWSNFDALIEFREREGAEWRSDIQILFSTANSLDKNRLRDLICASNGGLNLIRWDYRRNGLRYGQNPDIRLKILPRYVNFSHSSVASVVSENSGINQCQYLGSQSHQKPINLNNTGQYLTLQTDAVNLFSDLAGTALQTYSGLNNPSFAIQIFNGNYFIADKENNQVLEVSEDFTTLIDTIPVTEPIFLDYLEDTDTLLVTSSGGTISEFVRGSFILVWTSSTTFGELTSATYSKKDFNRIVTSDTIDNKIRIINKLSGAVTEHNGFQNYNGDSDSFVNPYLAIEFSDGSITVVEKNGRKINSEEFISSSSSSIDSSSTSSQTSSSLSSSSISSVSNSSSISSSSSSS